jgi:hypothetical protein
VLLNNKNYGYNILLVQFRLSFRGLLLDKGNNRLPPKLLLLFFSIIGLVLFETLFISKTGHI